MEFTAKQIADFIGGRVEGDDNATVHTFSKIEEGTKGSITFLSNPKYTQYIYDTKASIVLVNNDVVLDHPVEATLIRVENAYECVAKLLQLYAASMPKKKGIDPKASVSDTAVIGEKVYIGAFAVIGDNATVDANTQIYPHTVVGDNVKIGSGCTLYPNVTVYQGCVLGNNVT